VVASWRWDNVVKLPSKPPSSLQNALWLLLWPGVIKGYWVCNTSPVGLELLTIHLKGMLRWHHWLSVRDFVSTLCHWCHSPALGLIDRPVIFLLALTITKPHKLANIFSQQISKRHIAWSYILHQFKVQSLSTATHSEETNELTWCPVFVDAW